MMTRKSDSGGSTENVATRRQSIKKKESSGGGSSDDALCGICNKICKANDNALDCDDCSVWYHTACVGIPDAVYEFYCEEKMAKLQFYWKCATCCTKPKSPMEDQMSKYMEETNKTLVTMQKEIQGMKKIIKDEKSQQPEWAKEEIGSLKKLMKEDKAQPVSWAQVAAVGVKDTKALNKFATCVANKQKSINEDRQARENKVIIFNMKEEKEEKDTLKSKVESLCLDVECEKKPTNVERLGQIKPEKPVTENPRPIKVSFNSNFDKRIFLSKLRNLKGNNKYQNVRIQHDMSFEDRNENKRLLKEVYELNQHEDKDGKSMYKYKVRGPPWAMNIVRVKKN